MSSERGETPNDEGRRSSRRQSHRSSGVYLFAPSPKIHYPIDLEALPLESKQNTEKFERLSDSLEEMESYMTRLQQLHQSISMGFNEAFSSFLYGLSITMWCVDFPGCPSKKKWDQKHDTRQVNSRIRALEARLHEAEKYHKQLKLKLKQSEEDTRIIATSSSETKSNVKPITRSRSPIITTTKIPQLKSKPQDSNPIPNLNQPPRYMRGLFDSGSIRSSQKQQSKVTKPTTRPRFR